MHIRMKNGIKSLALDLCFQLDLCCAASTNSSMPVTKLESSDARNSAQMRSHPGFHSTHWNYGNEAVLHFLRSTVKYGRIYRTESDDIDSDLSFELCSPGSGKSTDRCFAGAVDCSARESFYSSNRTI